MKKSLNNPTNFMLFLLLSVIVSYSIKFLVFKNSEVSVDTRLSIVAGLLLSLIPFLILDILSGIRNHDGTLTSVNGLPVGYSITFKHASRVPTVKTSPKKFNTIIDFGNGTILISNKELNVVSITYRGCFAALVQNKNFKMFAGNWE